MSGFAVALGFLTRVPAPHRGALAAGALARAAVWFPVVGALVGLVLGGTRLLAELVLPAGAATVLALGAAALLTGGLHEDGLADTADGFGAHVPRERRLEIMRDSSIGTYGVLALVLTTLLAWSLLASLDGVACLVAAVAGHVVARWAMLVHAWVSPPARAGGLGGLLAVRPVALAGGTVVAAAITITVAGPLAGGVALLAGLVAAGGMTAAARRVIGGSTGDTFGALGKVAEVAVYAVIAVASTG